MTEIRPTNHKHVTYGDGVKGRVLGKGTLNVDGMPKLTNVLLVEGLKANLISISQLCDDDLFVRFTRQKCIVMNQDDKQVMEGTRSSDNCYLLAYSSLCHKTNLHEAEL